MCLILNHTFMFLQKSILNLNCETYQWRSEDVRGPWTTDSPGPAPPFSFYYLPFLLFSMSAGAPFSSGAPGHCPPMPPTRYATETYTATSYIERGTPFTTQKILKFICNKNVFTQQNVHLYFIRFNVENGRTDILFVLFSSHSS